MTKREDRSGIKLLDPELLYDSKFVRALGMVVAKARPQDPEVHAALRVCLKLVADQRDVAYQLGDVLLFVSLTNPYALAHWPLLGEVSFSFFPLHSA